MARQSNSWYLLAKHIADKPHQHVALEAAYRDPQRLEDIAEANRLPKAKV